MTVDDVCHLTPELPHTTTAQSQTPAAKAAGFQRFYPKRGLRLRLKHADELLDIGAREAEDRRIALIAQQRWETDGGALHPRHQLSGPATPARREVRGAH